MAHRNIVIKNGNVFDGERFFNADLLLSGGVIAGIGKYTDEDAADRDYVFDAQGMTVCAGLVDIHTHIWAVSPDEFGTSAEGTCFPSGVTCAVDGGADRGSRAVLDAMNISTAVFVCTSVKNDTVSFERTERLLEAYGERAIGIKLYFDMTGGQVHNIDALRSVCAYARARGLKVMVHCSHSPVPMFDIVDTLSRGDILTHIYHGAENTCEADDYSAFRLAREKGVVLDVGMAGHVHTDFGVLRRAVRRGMYPDTVSTDITNLSAFVRGGRYSLLTCMSIMRDAGVDETSLFNMVGRNAALAVGKSDECGTIAVGRRADIAVLEYTDAPYAFLQNEHNTICGERGYVCRLTVCDGRIVYRGR